MRGQHTNGSKIKRLNQRIYQLQHKVRKSRLRDHRGVSIPKRREGREWEARGGDKKSVGERKLFLNGSAGSEPLRTAQCQSQAVLAGSQFSGSACPE